MKLSLVIPTINRLDLLVNASHILASQAGSFYKLVIIDNGRQPGFLEHVASLGCPNILPVVNPRNAGVGPSWNQGIDLVPDTDWYLILNDDIEVGADQIRLIREYLEEPASPALDKYLVWNVGFCLFCISRLAIDDLKSRDGFVFDPQFYPAYFEDNDIVRRVMLLGKELRTGAECFIPSLFRNSQTLAKNPSLNQNFGSNQQKYIAKWGGLPAHERFTRPYNKP